MSIQLFIILWLVLGAIAFSIATSANENQAIDALEAVRTRHHGLKYRSQVIANYGLENEKLVYSVQD